MSKARKGQRLPDRAQLERESNKLPHFLDIIALVSLGATVIVGGGGYVLDMLYTRTIFTILMFCLVCFGSSFAISHFIRENPVLEKKYFNSWFGLMVVMVVLLIMSLGLPF